MACRDKARGEAAVEDVKKLSGNDKVEFMQLDLMSLESVRKFAEEFKARGLPLHSLINNAGIMALPERTPTKEGFEAQIGVNHLAHHLLTNLLLDKLRESSPSRVVCLASRAHEQGVINFDDLNSEKSYSAIAAYGQSKLANVLFAKELDRRMKAEGAKVTAYAVHPGVIQTELTRYSTLAKIFFFLGTPFLKSIPQGAATTVYCAIQPGLEEKSGSYFADCDVAQETALARNMDDAARLWELSDKLVGLKK